MTAYNVIDAAKLVSGQAEDISVVLANLNAIAAVLNGGLDNSNLNGAAAISASKIANYPSDVSKALLGDGTWGPGHANWTPTVAQSGSVTVNIISAIYMRLGKLVIAPFQVQCTQAGTAGNEIWIAGLPVASVNSQTITGYISILDNGTAWYHGAIEGVNTTTVHAHAHGEGNAIGVTPNFALANSDIISGQIIYMTA